MRAPSNRVSDGFLKMKLFECQVCGQPLYFENTRCERCGSKLGYLPDQATISALTEDKGQWRALADPNERYRFCANADYDVCNWLVAAQSREEFCAACRHNRTIPDLSIAQNLVNWRKAEVAKHRLIYTLLKLHLSLVSRLEDPNGLAFDFLVAAGQPVMTGHQNGLITINLAEADDSTRERERQNLAEPYRTLLGHFRHEIGHYFWDRFFKDEPAIEAFRAAFGDERQDYSAALERNYRKGPPPDWRDRFVSSYASIHPWEDFAETWAHYLHMVDTLETANAFGIRVRPRVANGDGLTAVVNFDPHSARIERILDAWLPLTFAMNSINRSMGLPDLYPFVLPPAVVEKLSFIHALVHHAQSQPAGEADRDVPPVGSKYPMQSAVSS